MAFGTTRDIYKETVNILNTAEREAFTQAVSTGDWKTASDTVFGSTIGTNADRNRVWKTLQDAVVSQGGWTGGGGQRVGGALREFQALVNQDFTVGEDPGQKAEREKKEFQKELNRAVFGTGTAETGTWVDTFLRGAAAGENISDKVTLQYMEDAGQKEDIVGFTMVANEAGGYDTKVTREEAEKLSKIEGFNAALGLDKDATVEEVKEAMENTDKEKLGKNGEKMGVDGGQKALAFMRERGMITDIVPAWKNKQRDAEINIKGTELDKADAANKKIEEIMKEEINKKFGVEGDTGFLEKLRDDPGLRSRILAGKDERAKQLLEWHDSQNKEIAIAQIDQELARQEKISKDNSGWNRLFVPGSKKDADEAVKNLKEARGKLTDDKGKEGDMIGVVKMILDEGVIMNLYKQRQ